MLLGPFGWPDLPTWHHCSGPRSYNDQSKLGSCIYECVHIQTSGTRAGPGLYSKYTKLFEAIFFQNWWQSSGNVSWCPGHYAGTYSAFSSSMHQTGQFVNPCMTAHIVSSTETWPTQQMRGSIFWVKTLTKVFEGVEEVKVKLSFFPFLSARHSALCSYPAFC